MLLTLKRVGAKSDPLNVLMLFISQGTPGSGGIPQIWGNLKNQILGNPPDMGKWQI